MTSPLRLTALAALLALAAPASAQVGIGGIVGEPTGLTFKIGAGRGAVALDINLDDAVYGQLHYLLRERSLQGSDVRLSFGPGIVVGEAGDEVAVGISALVGLGWYIDPQFEIFGQLTPRLIVTPVTDGGLYGGVGVRFYP